MGDVSFKIERLVDGGFAAIDEYGDALFAATTLDEALAYVRRRMGGEGKKDGAEEADDSAEARKARDYQREEYERQRKLLGVAVLSGQCAGLSMDTSDLVQQGRNAMRDAVNLRRA